MPQIYTDSKILSALHALVVKKGREYLLSKVVLPQLFESGFTGYKDGQDVNEPSSPEYILTLASCTGAATY